MAAALNETTKIKIGLTELAVGLAEFTVTGGIFTMSVINLFITKGHSPESWLLAFLSAIPTALLALATKGFIFSN